MNQNFKSSWLWIAAFVALLLFSGSFQNPSKSRIEEITFSKFLNDAQSGSIKKVQIYQDRILGEFTSGDKFKTKTAYNDNKIGKDLTDMGVDVSYQDDSSPTLLSIFINWFPMLLLIGVWVYFITRMQPGGGSGGGNPFSFGKSKAKMLSENKNKVTFNDVAGVDEAKEEVVEVVDFLKNPKKFEMIGAKIPKGVLLVGPPGTGKTLLARAIAGEANVPFFSISGSDFVEMFVGVGASRVRDMFEQAKKNAPCIVFIDEIDAVGRHRGAGVGGGNDEREQTLNQLLVEMDGFEGNEGVIILAATNRPDVLDKALLRPGRFDRQVHVSLPDKNGREKILKVHLAKIIHGPDVVVEDLAKGTPGFSGADLANLVNEAALLAARKGKRMATMADFEEAKDKILMGIERRSLAMTPEERRNTAYHEAGHAIVGLSLEDSDPIHKATIIPRGRALGMVMRLPEGDQISKSRSQIKADIAVAYGGRIAEDMFFGHEKVTTGASSDIAHATKLARAYVVDWGLDEELGPVLYNDQDDSNAYGIPNRKFSEKTAEKIDEKVKALLDECYNTALSIIKKRKKDLEKLAEALLEYETLTGDEINDLLAGKEIKPKLVEKVDNLKPKPSISVIDGGGNKNNNKKGADTKGDNGDGNNKNDKGDDDNEKE